MHAYRMFWRQLMMVIVLALPAGARAQTMVTEPYGQPQTMPPPAGDPSLAPTPLPPPEAAPPSVPTPGAPTPDPDDWDLPRPAPPSPPSQSAESLTPPTPMPPAPDFPEAPPPPPAYPPAPPGTVTRSPQLVGDCICQQRRTASLHDEAARIQQEYASGKSRLAALDGQLAATKPKVDADDESQLDAYRRLLLQSEEENARVFNDLLPRAQGVVNRYNQAVERYNQLCTGRRFDPAVTAQVSATLSCR